MTAIVLRGDARRLPLPDASVDLIVTSPPYFGLRSYTDNVKCLKCIDMERDGRDPRQAWPDYDAHVRDVHIQHYDGQIGSEATPAEWVAALVECTREWMRVLKPSGSMFINLGDKFSGNETGGALTEPGPALHSPMAMQQQAKRRARYRSGLPPKSLLGLPWRYALACTDQLGLILRRDIIWAKPNGLPESVTDRCRSSHEYVFHLVRQPRYYAAVDEIREPHTGRNRDGELQRGHSRRVGHGNNGFGFTEDFTREYNPLGKLPGSVWSIPSQPLQVPPHLGVDHFAAFPLELPRRCVLGWSPPGICTSCGEGRRPVVDMDWSQVPHQLADKRAYTAAERDEFGSGFSRWWRHQGVSKPDFIPQFPHYKNPESVIAQVNNWGRGKNVPSAADWEILARWLGDPPSRLTELVHLTRLMPTAGGFGGSELSPATGLQLRHKTGQGMTSASAPPKTITGYACACPTPDAPTRPATVLDPFMGTGTTLLAASALGRTGIGVDLSADYCRLARWRTQDPGERAKAMQVPKPPPVPDAQDALFEYGLLMRQALREDT